MLFSTCIAHRKTQCEKNDHRPFYSKRKKIETKKKKNYVDSIQTEW